jgi:hypothetical protein
MSEETKSEKPVWVKPSDFIASKSIKVVDGSVLDPEQLGMPEHPTFGKLPVLTVLVANDDNTYFILGCIDCACGVKREVHAGDWHQVRGCKTCTKTRQRAGNRAAGASPEAQLLAQLARTVKEAERKAKLDAAKAKVAAENAAIQEKARLEHEALVAKVAAEKGVGVSQAS